MGLRFRKSINLGKHFRINLSSKGIGYSYGTKGYRHTVSADGKERITTSIPGTGLSSTKYINTKSSAQQKSNTVHQRTEPRESVKEQYIRTRGNASLFAILSVIFILSGIVSYLFLLPVVYMLAFVVIGIIFALMSINKRGKYKKLESQMNDEPKQQINLNIDDNSEIVDDEHEIIDYEKEEPTSCDILTQDITASVDKDSEDIPVNVKVFNDVMRRTRERIAKSQYVVQEKKEIPESEKD